MNVMVPIPDELAERLTAQGGDIGRRALEALVLEEFRAGRTSKAELRKLLGLESRYEMDGFLKAHGVYEDFSAEEIHEQIQDLDRQAAANDIVARFQAFAAGHTLGGLGIKDLISEGRR